MLKKSPLPDWFDLSRYDEAKVLDLKTWYGHLENRYLVKLLLDESAGTDDRPAIHQPDSAWLFCFRHRSGEGEECCLQERKHLAGERFSRFQCCPISKEIYRPTWLQFHKSIREEREQQTSYRVWAGLTTQDTIQSRTLGDTFQDYLWLNEHEDKASKSALAAGLTLVDSEYNSLEYRKAMATLLWPSDLARYQCGSKDHKELHIKVDLYATDNQILSDFKEWLAAARQTFNIPEPSKKAPKGAERERGSAHLFTEGEVQDWDRFRILPYIDLMIWQDLMGSSIKRHELARALFPNEYDVDLTGRLDKVVRPKADWLMRPEVLEAFRKQVHSEILRDVSSSES